MHAMTYKGYTATIEFDPEIRTFHGQVINANSIITFYGSSVNELEAEFAKSMEIYFEHCAKTGKRPDKPYSGRLNLRASPELHARLASAAANEGKSLNEWAVEHLKQAA
ncbi:MAG: type II toxin-antitoxin system HicB family antitoxin [Mariprofundaceae bacterium]|nr:type II toxin-antitoxin system HicB family antitoxin [Mariprofundaceae bacterium]